MPSVRLRAAGVGWQASAGGCQGPSTPPPVSRRRPSSSRRGRGLVSPPRTVPRRTGVGCSAVPQPQRRSPSVQRSGQSRLGRVPGATGGRRACARAGAPRAGTAGPPRRGPGLGWRPAAVWACACRRRAVWHWLDRRAQAQAHEASRRWSVCPRSRRGPWLGWPVAVLQAWPSRCGPVWWQSSRLLVASAGVAASSPTVQASACVPGRRGAQGAAGGAGWSPGGRGQEPRGPHGCTARVPWWWGGTVSRAACACIHVLCGCPEGPAGAHGASGGRSGRDAGARRGRTRACS